MRLTQVRVRDYRSIHDSGEIEIETYKTLLVGVNEAGKTAILKAIEQIKAPSGTAGFSALKDYPRSRYTEVQRGDRDPSDILVVEALFTLSPPDRTAIANSVPEFADVSQLTIYRYLDNSVRYNFGNIETFSKYEDIEKDIIRLRAHLVKQGANDIVSTLDGIIAKRTSYTRLLGSFATNLSQWLNGAFRTSMKRMKKRSSVTTGSRHMCFVTLGLRQRIKY